MLSPRNISLEFPALEETKLTWFRFGTLEDNIILTTDAGDWHLMTPEAFSSFISGTLEEDGEEYAALLGKGFIRNGFDAELQGGLIRRTKNFLYSGVHHHRIHLSTTKGTLPVEQAKAILDHVFTSQADSLTIVMVQGPAALDASLISFIHEFAEEKNKYERRQITYRIYGTLDGLDGEMAQTIVDKKIQLRALFDGFKSVHNAQRETSGGAPYAATLERILTAHAVKKDAGESDNVHQVSAEVHVGKNAVGEASSIIQGLQEANIKLFRMAPILEGEQAIDPTAYGEFIDELLTVLNEHEGEQNAPREIQIDALMAWIRGGDVTEPLTSTRPATGYNARSYNISGHIYPSCSALLLADQEDNTFLLGDVATDTMESIAGHATLRTLIVASATDCLPGYQHLWSTPYLSPDPIAAYKTTGNIFTTTTTSVFHLAAQAMVEKIFLHVLAKDLPQEE